MCVFVNEMRGARSLKGKWILGTKEEVSIHVILQDILVTISWEVFLTNGHSFHCRGGLPTSADLCQGTHEKPLAML